MDPMDMIIPILFIGVSLGIGLYHAFASRGSGQTSTGFMMADRHLSVLPTILSMLVSYQSAIFILGIVAEMFNYGARAWLWKIVSLFIAIGLSQQILVPWLYRMKLISVYEYFELRFQSTIVRKCASLMGIFYACVYMGLAMYAPSIAFEITAGIPLKISIPIMAVVTTIYTTLGGMKAVIWTDVFQFFVIIFGLVLILIKGFVYVGGIQEVFSEVSKAGRLNWINLSMDPRERHTIWGFTIGWTLYWLNVYGFNQSSVQRFSATSNLRQARFTVLMNGPVYGVSMSIVCLIGLTLFAFYNKMGCDPLNNRDIVSSNQLLPYFVKELFADWRGFNGLFLSILYSGAMSSISSSLSSASANTWEDFLKTRLKVTEERKAAMIIKSLVVFFGCISVMIAFAVSYLSGHILQVASSLLGSTACPAMGMFILGGTFRFANVYGALAGGLSSLLVLIWLNISSIPWKSYHPRLPSIGVYNCSTPNLYPLLQTYSRNPIGIENFYAISYMWYIPIGLTTCLLVGTIVSKLTETDLQREKNCALPDCLFIRYKDLLRFRITDEDEDISIVTNTRKLQDLSRDLNGQQIVTML